MKHLDKDSALDDGHAKPRITRLRTGCLTCRKRRKRCDNQSPTSSEPCQTCVRLQLTCLWPVKVRPRSNSHELQSLHTGAARARADDARSDDVPEQRLCGGPRQPGPLGQGERHGSCERPDDEEAPYDREPYGDSAILAFDYDEEKQVKDEPMMTLDLRDEIKTLQQMLPQSGLPTHEFTIDRLHPAPENIQRLLIDRYIHHLSTSSLMVHDNRNGFRFVCLPLASKSHLLYSAILAFSSNYLSLLFPDFDMVARRCEMKAIRELRRAVARRELCDVDVLSSALLLAGGATITRNMTAVDSHLEGMRQIINLTDCASQMNESSRDFLLSSFAYHDVLRALVRCEKAYEFKKRWRPDLKQMPSSLMVNLQDIFQVLSEFTWVRSDLLSNAITPKDAASIGWQLISRLVQCDQAPCVYNKLARDAYLHGALIMIHAMLRRCMLMCSELSSSLETVQVRINISVARILNSIETIVQEGKIESSFSFPVFVAGCECMKPEQMEQVKNIIGHLAQNPASSHQKFHIQFLEKVWNLRQRGEWFDWEEMLASPHCSIALL